jgi:hypothetical protein
MHVAFEQLPSPLMGEGAGGGEDSPSSPPSQPSPAKGGRGIYLPLSAARGEEVGRDVPHALPRMGKVRVGVRQGERVTARRLWIDGAGERAHRIPGGQHNRVFLKRGD